MHKKVGFSFVIFFFLQVLLWHFFASHYTDRTIRKKSGGQHTRSYSFNITDKVDFFERDLMEQSNVLFIGDSRTLIAYDPYLFDQMAKTSSYNFGAIAFELDGQYLLMKHLLKMLKHPKTFILTIGHLNFENIGDEVSSKFPMSFSDMLEFHEMGFVFSGMQKNIMRTLLGENSIIASAAMIKNVIDRKLNTVLVEKSQQGDFAIVDNGDAFCNQKRASELNTVEIIKTGQHHYIDGKVSVCMYRSLLGQEIYIERESEKLRSKQKELEEKITAFSHFEPKEKNMKIFEKILELFKDSVHRLVIVEYWDTPYNYKIKSNLEAYETFLAQIEATVRGYGYTYIKPDFHNFKNNDYFDYNHMNLTGSKKFTLQVAKAYRDEITDLPQ